MLKSLLLHEILIKLPIAQRKLNSRLSIGDKAQIQEIRGHDFDFCQFTIFYLTLDSLDIIIASRFFQLPRRPVDINNISTVHVDVTVM